MPVASLAVGVAHAARIETTPERPKRPRLTLKAEVLGQRVRIRI